MLQSIFFDRLFLVFLVLFTGALLAKLKLGKIGLGASGSLFTGIVIGWFAVTLAKSVPESSSNYKNAQTLILNDVVPNEYFILFLSLFICSVGLLASKNLNFVLKKYGAKFMILGVIITFVGAVVSFGYSSLSNRYQPFELIGTFPGAMTSNPGLAAGLQTAEDQADYLVKHYTELDLVDKQRIKKILNLDDTPIQLSLQQATDFKKRVEIGVGVSHTVSYPFGVLVVLFAIIIFPKLFGIDIAKDKKRYFEEMQNIKQMATKKKPIETISFDIIAFSLTLATGWLIGLITIPLPFLGDFSLGSVGGILIMSLLLGSFQKIGFLNFNMEEKILVIIQQLSVAFIFTVIGLRFGYHVIETLFSGGIYIALAATVVALVAITIGFLIGHYLFKINWVLLSGALCGGMTSTPGLSIAVDTIESNDPAVGYGATYPIALICMITFSIILSMLII